MEPVADATTKTGTQWIYKAKGLAIIIRNCILNPFAFLRLITYLVRNPRLRGRIVVLVRTIARSGRYATDVSIRKRISYFIQSQQLLDIIANNYSHDNARLQLWKHFMDDSSELTIQLSESYADYQREGELDFSLFKDNQQIIALSSVIARNSEYKSSCIFVTRVQGAIGHYDEIKSVNKHFNDMNSSFLLLSALEGFSIEFGFPVIMAVPSERQISFSDQKSNFTSTYDIFWNKAGAVVNENGYFEVSVPLAINEPGDGAHQSRHRKHAETRKRVSEETIKSLARLRLEKIMADTESKASREAPV